MLINPHGSCRDWSWEHLVNVYSLALQLSVNDPQSLTCGSGMKSVCVSHSPDDFGKRLQQRTAMGWELSRAVGFKIQVPTRQ